MRQSGSSGKGPTEMNQNQNRKDEDKEGSRGRGSHEVGGSQASMLEREVQKRVTSALSSAGVGPGRISLEVLYMLPVDFTRTYVKLFDRALAESVKGAGEVDARAGAKIGKVSNTRRGFSRGASGGGGGKRYRTHWVIRDEEIFKLKGSIDRRLIRLAGKIDRAISRTRDTIAGEIICTRCNHNCTDIAEEFGKGRVQRCVRCGGDLEELE